MDLVTSEYENPTLPTKLTNFSNFVDHCDDPICHIDNSSNHFCSGLRSFYEGFDMLNTSFGCVELKFCLSFSAYGLEMETNADRAV